MHFNLRFFLSFIQYVYCAFLGTYVLAGLEMQLNISVVEDLSQASVCFSA